MLDALTRYVIIALGAIILLLQIRTELERARSRSGEGRESLEEMGRELDNIRDQMLKLHSGLDALYKNQERLTQTVSDEMRKDREETGSSSKALREELINTQKALTDSTLKTMKDISELQQEKLGSFAKELANLTKTSEEKLETVRAVVERQLRHIQEDNNKKLEEMRITVDEKLHSTLERRLGESFKQVSENLEQVYKGLGEMKNLAAGVGDLKKVLTNVKNRGIFGEIQLENILEDILTPDQYMKNVATKRGSTNRVEFAVKLPGQSEEEPVLLPIDAKFPQEDYIRLLDAYDSGDAEEMEQAGRGLENQIRSQAKDINEKYISVPDTTDFAIMFLPTESLYAEVLRRPGLAEAIQRQYKVQITGPCTLAAFLNSLSVGFRTLAIQKRAGEVWDLLGAIKTEFGKFGNVLDRVKKQLETASNTIESAQRRTRVINRKLRNVEELPAQTAVDLLGQDWDSDQDEDRDEDLYSDDSQLDEVI